MELILYALDNTNRSHILTELSSLFKLIQSSIYQHFSRASTELPKFISTAEYPHPWDSKSRGDDMQKLGGSGYPGVSGNMENNYIELENDRPSHSNTRQRQRHDPQHSDYEPNDTGRSGSRSGILGSDFVDEFLSGASPTSFWSYMSAFVTLLCLFLWR